jgi:peroxiredoxin
MAIINRHSDLLSDQLITKITEKLDPVSYDQMATAIDCVLVAQAVHASANEEMHLRTLRRQDTIILALEGQSRTDAELQLRIEAIQTVLNQVMGITEKSREEQREFAITDSLQSELLRLKQEQFNRERMRQMEEQHREELKQIKKATKIIEDDGETNVIKVKPRKAKKKKEFRERVLLPL